MTGTMLNTIVIPATRLRIALMKLLLYPNKSLMLRSHVETATACRLVPRAAWNAIENAGVTLSEVEGRYGSTSAHHDIYMGEKPCSSL